MRFSCQQVSTLSVLLLPVAVVAQSVLSPISVNGISGACGVAANRTLDILSICGYTPDVLNSPNQNLFALCLCNSNNAPILANAVTACKSSTTNKNVADFVSSVETLSQSCQDISVTSFNVSSTDTSPSINGLSPGGIAGAVIGGLLLVLLVAGTIYWIVRKQRKQSTQSDPTTAETSEFRTAIPTPTIATATTVTSAATPPPNPEAPSTSTHTSKTNPARNNSLFTVLTDEKARAASPESSFISILATNTAESTTTASTTGTRFHPPRTGSISKLKQDLKKADEVGAVSKAVDLDPSVADAWSVEQVCAWVRRVQVEESVVDAFRGIISLLFLWIDLEFAR
ncbi:hypothetical protein BC830DRAFT_1113011 [Chytriomyces sp. MP71]|nr:hypothetical protein BC830DRAFT_1113011 [Chytriomyces sp. MP71]